MDSRWKDFDKINDAHEQVLKVINKIEKKKTQRIVGKKPSQYIVECSVCNQPTMIAFTGFNLKKKGFICFNCLSQD